ncbi:AAA family ATPase [Pseudoruegeria sp. HB172150]|uniref:AAA family ATPase n=1 Tax=Pseudoruegeria sp. HB172150 TaxID=2721164 RepID=UPI001551A13D|nr:ATP-binding protein [Pseudoruegeria sp. HB172150]
MAEEQMVYNSVAPLRNVAALAGLVDRVKNRSLGLPGMACYYGPSGFGKSTAGIWTTNKYRAVLVQVQSVWTPKLLCEAIALEAGVQLRRGDTTGHLVKNIAEALAITDQPLLIDEADHLIRRKCIEVIRDIHESSGAPIILIGEEGLPQKLKEWERVHGRMLDWVAAQPGDLSDVKHLAPIYARGIEIDADLQSAILRASHGSIRRICVNLDRVAEFARTRGITKMTLALWQGDLFTGEAPTARKSVA